MSLLLFAAGSSGSQTPWLDMTREQVMRARGAIATTLANLPFGPRPNQDDNCLFTAEYINPCWTPDQRIEQIGLYPHVAWPLNPPLAKGYHGQFPDTDLLADFDAYLDRMEELWLAGKMPEPALIPDCAPAMVDGRLNRQWIIDTLQPLYLQPRFQAMARRVRMEWEFNIPAEDWQWLSYWCSRIVPNAIICLHLESGHGAPGLSSELAPLGPYADEGAMWMPVAPFIHCFKEQDTFAFMGATDHGRTPMQQIAYNLQDMARRFNEVGYRPSFPCGISANGPGIGIQVSADEYGSYACEVSREPRVEADAAFQMGRMALGEYDPVIDYDGTPLYLTGRLVGFGDGGPSPIS